MVSIRKDCVNAITGKRAQLGEYDGVARPSLDPAAGNGSVKAQALAKRRILVAQLFRQKLAKPLVFMLELEKIFHLVKRSGNIWSRVH
ncbi:hypothetical protein SAMN03159406_04866 [Rhizobium sp. NFR03]|nr:hypothetical protein SAMN03159406_04866 [Rhizobium sp. NFR03]